MGARCDLIAIFALARDGAAQERPQLEKTLPASQDTSIYPAPNYGGHFWLRSYVTGDWGGRRSKLADRGVQFDSNLTQIYQGVASGGTNRTGRYSGSLDRVLKLDFHKLGLWPGGFMFAEAQVPYGNTVNPYSGGVLPVNTLLAITTPALNELILPHLYFTQFLTEWFAVVLGKLDTTGGDANEFAHGRGDDKFMNLAFSFNPVSIRLAPYAPLGMVLSFFPHKDVVYGFSVVDPQGLPNTAGFNTLVEDPTALTHELRVTIRPFGLTGHQLLGFGWANKPFTLLTQDPRTIIDNVLVGTPLKTGSDTWAVYYNFDQYLYQDKQDPTGALGFSSGPGWRIRIRTRINSSIASVLRTGRSLSSSAAAMARPRTAFRSFPAGTTWCASIGRARKFSTAHGSFRGAAVAGVTVEAPAVDGAAPGLRGEDRLVISQARGGSKKGFRKHSRSIAKL